MIDIRTIRVVRVSRRQSCSERMVNGDLSEKNEIRLERLRQPRIVDRRPHRWTMLGGGGLSSVRDSNPNLEVEVGIEKKIGTFAVLGTTRIVARLLACQCLVVCLLRGGGLPSLLLLLLLLLPSFWRTDLLPSKPSGPLISGRRRAPATNASQKKIAYRNDGKRDGITSIDLFR